MQALSSAKLPHLNLHARRKLLGSSVGTSKVRAASSIIMRLPFCAENQPRQPTSNSYGYRCLRPTGLHYSKACRLRHAWARFVTYPARWQKEQSHQRPTPHLRIMVRPGPWTRPPGPLPPIHALQLGCAVVLQRDHAVDLPVGMLVVLAAEGV